MSHCNHIKPFYRYYLAYAPRILRAGVVEKVLVTTSNVTFDVKVKATLTDGRDDNKHIAVEKAIVKPGICVFINQFCFNKQVRACHLLFLTFLAVF